MRILLVHNRYQIEGGEDSVVDQELRALENHPSFEARLLLKDNESLSSFKDKVKTALEINRSPSAVHDFEKAVSNFRPDVIHVHNFFPLWSPGIFEAAQKMGLPTVLSLHNFRLFCSQGFCLLNGKNCTQCVDKTYPWPSVVNRCYRGSLAGSASVAWMQSRQRTRWPEQVNAFIALSQRSRERFIKFGLPPDRLHLKPNFLDEDPGMGSHQEKICVFAGRLSPEKGVLTLLRAWKNSPRGWKLVIAGTGPLENEVRALAGADPSIKMLGKISRPELFRLMKDSALFIFPSEWDEIFGMVIIEAMATGNVIITSDIAASGTDLVHGHNSLSFRSGDAEHLNTILKQAVAGFFPLDEISRNARRDFESKFSRGQHLARIAEIYSTVIKTS